MAPPPHVLCESRAGSLLLDRRLTLTLRLIVGAVFIYAGYDGLLDPQPLADAIDDYRILPLGLVNIAAVALPWIELFTGLCLLVGSAAAGAGVVTSVLATTYSAAIVSVLVRGLDISCGCFGAATPLTWHDLWLRLAMGAAGVQIALSARTIDWPLAALRRRARDRRSARDPRQRVG